MLYIWCFIFPLKKNSHPTRYEVLSHCGFICIAVMISDIGYLFMYLQTICVSSLRKCPFKSVAHFLIGLFVFCCCWVLGVCPILVTMVIEYVLISGKGNVPCTTTPHTQTHVCARLLFFFKCDLVFLGSLLFQIISLLSSF